VKRAEGEKQARIRQAEADAERVRLQGEAAAKIVSVTADAEAHRVQVEGNAEAGIVFTKGEAEAKALALRAEAYRQFNEAAVIQTVLSMLPEIVRAAAEPMANISQLTVLSNDGASEMVKNTTRTVAEASATVKGLTGIDVPALLGSALGGSKGGGGGRGGGGGAGGAPARPTRGGRGRAAAPAQAGASAGTAREGAAATSGEVPPAQESPTEAFARAARAINEAGHATPTQPAVPPVVAAPAASPAPTSDRAAGPARPSAAITGVTSDTTLDDAFGRLASDLRTIPGIERFRNVRLQELERAGPRPLRAIWRVARDQLDERYGQLTIGDVLERLRNSGGSGGSGASTGA
jgi:flotillin